MRLDRQALSDMNYQTTSRIRPILPGGNSSFCHDPTELLLESAETTQTPEKELFCGETTSGRHGAGLGISFERISQPTPSITERKTRAPRPAPYGRSSQVWDVTIGSASFHASTRRQRALLPSSVRRTRGAVRVGAAVVHPEAHFFAEVLVAVVAEGELTHEAVGKLKTRHVPPVIGVGEDAT